MNLGKPSLFGAIALALSLSLPLAFGGVAHADAPVTSAAAAVQSKSVITHIRTQDGLKLHLQKDIPLNPKPLS